MDSFRHLVLVLIVVAAGANAAVCRADVDPADRTADLPDSWLVLYNLNDTESGLWANWYRQVRGIPQENVLGLDASTSEHLPDLAAAQTQILGPVQDYLDANPDIEQRIMGIVVGYRVPGHFGQPPLIPNVGGFAVCNALQDMTNTTIWEMNPDCPHMVGPDYGALPAGGRLTKATMCPGHYMTARIDARTISKTLEITLRAMDIEDAQGLFPEDIQVWYDYCDPVIPGGEWYWLKVAVENEDLAEVPWGEYDADSEQTPNDGFRFGTHDVNGWNDLRLFGIPTGPRVLALNLNSWGATTVRSCDAEGGRYVPNALEAGYAAAIGATGEPQCCVCPFPDTLLEALREGWTLGEAFYLANPYDDWMWIVVGDPFLTLPEWFPDEVATTVDGAASCIEHNGAEYCLPLALAEPATVEPRLGGVTRLVLQTAAPVEAGTTTATATCLNGAYTGTITVTSDGTTSVTVSLDRLPDEDYCTIEFDGGIDDSVSVSVVAGDVDGEGTVTTADGTSITQRLGMVVDGSNFWFDVDLDGRISTADGSFIYQRLGNNVQAYP